MEPEIIHVDPFTVMGVQSHSPYETDDFGPSVTVGLRTTGDGR